MRLMRAVDKISHNKHMFGFLSSFSIPARQFLGQSTLISCFWIVKFFNDNKISESLHFNLHNNFLNEKFIQMTKRLQK